MRLSAAPCVSLRGSVLTDVLHFKMSLSTKLLFSFLGLSMLGLGAFGHMAVTNMRALGAEALQTSTSLGWSAISDSAVVFEALYRANIEQKAQDTAREATAYLEARPGLSVAELQGDSLFRTIALQRVGKSGSTAILDADSGVFYLHSQAELVGFDSRDLAATMPSAWKTIEPAIDRHQKASGYFDWKDANGTVSQQYMSSAYVTRPTGDGHNLLVIATGYVEEFSMPSTTSNPRIIAETMRASNQIESRVDSTNRGFFVILAVLSITIVALSVLLSRAITRPIWELRRGTEEIGRGNFEYRVRLRCGDEIQDLADAFNNMAMDLTARVRELRLMTAERVRFQKELEIAKEIQQTFLPESVPEIEGIELAAMNSSAREVGGDFYDFVKLADGRWGLAIADVSGKGIPAALFMAMSRTLLRVSAETNSGAAEAVEKANDLIFANAKSSMFVTLFYAELDCRTRRLTYVNAGHNPPLLFRASTGEMCLLSTRGLALGVAEGIPFEQAEVQLEMGDLIVLYTDGVTEATDDAGNQFEISGLRQIVEDRRQLAVEQIVREIESAVMAFSGHEQDGDDITLMALKVI